MVCVFELRHAFLYRMLSYASEVAKATESVMDRSWWQPLISLINFVLLGYCLKTYFGWDRVKTTRFRRITFNILLPVYVLRNMWIARIDESMYAITKASLLVHVGQAVFWALLYRNVTDPCMRGWLSMISQGCLTSFFYANLGAHPQFGQQAVAICLMWDIGGNTPCAQGLLWGLAAYFAPDPHKDPPQASFETAFSSPLLAIHRRDASVRDGGDTKVRKLPRTFGTICRSDLESVEGEDCELRSLLDDRSGKISSDNRKSVFDILRAVLYQPILPAFGAGLLLSSYGIGCPVAVDYSLEAVGLFFKPCLYFLIGLYSEGITSSLQLKIIVTALGLRYLFSGFVATIMWLWLPFDSLERTTMALSLLSPVSTMTMYLAAEYNYPTQFLSMSATLTTISVFISFIIQEAVMRSY